jgi:ankyrin repeat protein
MNLCTSSHRYSQASRCAAILLIATACFTGPLAHAQSDDLISASARGDLPAVNALLKSGADVNEMRGQKDEGQTALTLASQNGHLEVVKALLAAGANANPQCCGRWTPLVYAAERQQLEMVRVLLAAKADPNPNVTLHGQTVLVRAINMNHLDIARALIDGGASVATGGVTPLMAAVGKSGPGILELVQAILAAHADVNTRCDYTICGTTGNTPLGIAASSGSVDIVQALLASSSFVDVNAKQVDGNTPLIIASAKGRVEVVRLLLAAKADASAVNGDGKTALMLALENNHPEVAELLRSAIAAVPAVN